MAYSGPSGFLPPTGLAAFLQQPGLRDLLLATGSGLLQQKDSPGSLGGALGRALPVGMQAFQQGQQKAGVEDLIKTLPPEQQQFLRMMDPNSALAAMFRARQPQAPVALGANERLVDPGSGEEVVGALPPPAKPTEYMRITQGSSTLLVDPTTLEVVKTFEGPPPAEDDAGFTLSPGQTRYDAAGNPVASAPALASETAPKPPNDAERKAAAVLPAAEQGLAIIEGLTSEFGGAPGLSSLLSGPFGRFAQRGKVQQFTSAARAIASAILRTESGASISDKEVEQFMEAFVPQPGDKAETVEQKMDRLRTRIMELRRQAGTAASPAAGPEEITSAPSMFEKYPFLRKR